MQPPTLSNSIAATASFAAASPPSAPPPAANACVYVYAYVCMWICAKLRERGCAHVFVNGYLHQTHLCRLKSCVGQATSSPSQLINNQLLESKFMSICTSKLEIPPTCSCMLLDYFSISASKDHAPVCYSTSVVSVCKGKANSRAHPDPAHKPRHP